MSGKDPEVLVEPEPETVLSETVVEAEEGVKVLQDHSEDCEDNDPKKANDIEPVAALPTMKKFPMREITIGPLRFNWLVSLLGLGVLWGVAFFCIASPDASATLGKWYSTTIQYFTW